jgi:methanogenic corrinoid protein MtbC1
MESQETPQDILDELQDAVVEFDQNRVRETALRALSEGVDPFDAIMNGLAGGMERVGELYAHGEYFLPELTMCAEAFYAGLDLLRPLILRSAKGPVKATVVIGTIEGDRHDIGKKVVRLLLEAAGCEVCDLGVDVSPERFVRESIRTKADLVCLSATLTTGLTSMAQIVDGLRLSNPRVRILVGGSAVSQQQARRWGVDGYSADALSLWRVVIQLMDAPLPQNYMFEAAGRSTNGTDSWLAGNEPPISLNLFQASSNE